MRMPARAARRQRGPAQRRPPPPHARGAPRCRAARAWQGGGARTGGVLERIERHREGRERRVRLDLRRARGLGAGCR